MQTRCCHLQNYKDLFEPAEGKDHLDWLIRIIPKICPSGTLVCVVYKYAMPAIGQVRINIRQSFITKIII